jgi:hypothetical protein
MDLLTQPAALGVIEPPSTSSETTDESLKRAIRGLITRLTPLVRRDRRRYVRHPMPLLMELTPVNAETEEPVGSAIVVVGKSLSEQGIGFFHQHALPYRHAIVRVEDGAESELALLVDLAWCRYTRYGWYESGGTFLKMISESIVT